MFRKERVQDLRTTEFIRKAINDVFDRLYNQIDRTDEKTGRPVLNSKTVTKLHVLRPFMDRLNRGESVTTDEQKTILETCLHVSTNMTAKLEGVNALSTACSVNPVCKARSRDCNSICAHCFAFLTFERYSDLEQAEIINFIVLNAMVYSVSAWKEKEIPTNNGLFRIEAFGDVASSVQCGNYIVLAYTHSFLTNIGIWSKNLGFWSTAFNALGKPANVVFNASSPVVNEIMSIRPGFEWFIDHVFTVFSADFALANNIEISCGDRVCRHCKRCYNHCKSCRYVNEILKQEATRYYKAIGKEFTGRR